METIEFIQVKGHQKNSEGIEDLEWPVKMKIHCNQLATTVHEKYEESLETISLLPANNIKLKIKQRNITNHILPQIRYLWRIKKIN